MGRGGWRGYFATKFGVGIWCNLGVGIEFYIYGRNSSSDIVTQGGCFEKDIATRSNLKQLKIGVGYTRQFF